MLETDISPTILDFTRARIEAAGLNNVRFAVAVADAEQPVHAEELPFDAVTCRLGLMLFAQPTAAMAAQLTISRLFFSIMGRSNPNRAREEHEPATRLKRTVDAEPWRLRLNA